MIVRVWEKASKALDDVYIATDNQDIYNVANQAGAKVLMTSSDHKNGTERISEAAKIIFEGKNTQDQVIINVQGDEPMISPGAIKGLCDAFIEDQVEIATLIHEITGHDDLKNPDRPKVVLNSKKNAMYFSRAIIPWNSNISALFEKNKYYQHVGVYAFRYQTLLDVVNLLPTPLEQLEKLEQLRWLENGYSIRCVETDYKGIGIDSPEDLEKLIKLLNENQDFW